MEAGEAGMGVELVRISQVESELVVGDALFRLSLRHVFLRRVSLQHQDVPDSRVVLAVFPGVLP
jgi:hypothetical protein